MKVSIDFETFSECDLKTAGAWIYSCHPTTEVLCMAYAYGNEEPQLWLPGDDLPDFVQRPGEYELHAWNAPFEIQIWHNTLKWPKAPLHLWTDTMALAAAMALPMALGTCAKAIGLPLDKQKDKRGKILIQRLCKPYRGERVNDPKLLQELYDYCLQDVVAEREIGKRLLPLRGREPDVWELDQKINFRGVYIDREVALAIIDTLDTRASYLTKKFKLLTNGAVSGPRSFVALKKWVEKELGCPLESIDKVATKELLKSDIPDYVKEVLEIKMELSKSSTAKFKSAVARTTDEDPRARGLFAYHAASTGRWAGRGIQLQNLQRDSYVDEDFDGARKLFINRDAELIEALFDVPQIAASRMVRGTIMAPPGKVLLCADFSAIEGRGLAYLAGEDWVLDEYRAGKDLYKVTAAIALGKQYEEITKSERNKLGKPGELGCGYGGGPNAIRNVGGGEGMTDEEIYEQIVTPWRKARPNIVQYWYDVERAAMNAIGEPGTTFACRSIEFKVLNNILFCKLPSGRLLSYCNPSIEDVETPWGATKPAIVFYGMKVVEGKTTTQWGKVITRGAKLVENIVQAFCRDLLAEAMLRLDAVGYNIVAHIHDEVVCEEDVEGNVPVELQFEAMCDIMSEVPSWAKGMPISAEGWVSKRYRKD